MDVTQILASSNSKHDATNVEKNIPLDVDVGYLIATDYNPVDAEFYEADVEEYLKSVARDGAQVLLSSLLSLPTQSSADGPLATLPPHITQLPRAKPLPKPKPLTKWERFASAKGIQKKRHEKKVWDDEKQEWVDSWGYRGKNRREKEEQWITEVPLNDAPLSTQKNVVKKIDRTLATSRISTASLGKFDKKLEGEKKLRGVKRKFDLPETIGAEKKASLMLISKLNGMQKKTGKEEKILNVRKAIRSTNQRKNR